MDMDKTLFLRELQRIANALEESNELQKQKIALFKISIKSNDENHQETMDINRQALEATQSWIAWNKQCVDEYEKQQRLASRLAMKGSNSNDDFNNASFDALMYALDKQKFLKENNDG